MHIKNKKLIIIVILLIALFLFMFNCYPSHEIVIAKNPTKYLEKFQRLDNKIDALLDIINFQEDGYADYLYDKAFQNYLMKSEDYFKILTKKNVPYPYPLINNKDFKAIIGVPVEIKLIYQGSKKKYFLGWAIYEKDRKSKYNIDFIYTTYCNILFDIAKLQEKQKKEKDLLITYKTIYCFLNHFQYNYFSQFSLIISLNNKMKLFNMIATFYKLKENKKEEFIKMQNYIEAYRQYAIFITETSISLDPHFIKIFNPFTSALNFLLYFNLHNIEDFEKLANYSNFRYLQYKSIKEIILAKKIFWKPIQCYKASRIINRLEHNNQDLIIMKIIENQKKLKMKEDFDYFYEIAKIEELRQYLEENVKKIHYEK